MPGFRLMEERIMFGKLSIWEIVLVVVLALVLFGGGKLAGVGKALGQSIRDFKKELKADEPEMAEDKSGDAAQ